MQPEKPILLAEDTVTQGDFDRLIEWLKTYPRLTKGQQTVSFEQEWAKVMGTKYAVFVNSGSSANLLMFAALLESGRLKGKSKKVLVPSLCWITTISPVIQLGLEPVLLDCNMEDLSVDIDHLKRVLETEAEKPSCLILVPILGLVPEMEEILAICKKHDVILLVDNCEGQGSKYSLDYFEPQVNGICLENYGLMASCSTYFGHILSTIEGGMITTDDEDLYNLVKMLRSHGWDRDIDVARKHQLQSQHNITGFNALYTFYHPAYNLRSTDLNAFIGLMQLKRLPAVSALRFRNYQHYYKMLQNDFWKQEEKANVFISNLGFPIIHPKRDLIVADLQENLVEVRPLVSGSMGQQPFYKKLYGEANFPNVNKVDQYGFYVPNHPNLSFEDIEFICEIINKRTNS